MYERMHALPVTKRFCLLSAFLSSLLVCMGHAQAFVMSGNVDKADNDLVLGWFCPIDPSPAALAGPPSADETTPISVNIYIDGALAHRMTANEPRQDLISPNTACRNKEHGFRWKPPFIGPGKHEIRIEPEGMDQFEPRFDRTMLRSEIDNSNVGEACLPLLRNAPPYKACTNAYRAEHPDAPRNSAYCYCIAGEGEFYKSRSANTRYLYSRHIRAGVHQGYGGTIFELFGPDHSRNLTVAHPGGAIQASLWATDVETLGLKNAPALNPVLAVGPDQQNLNNPVLAQTAQDWTDGEGPNANSEVRTTLSDPYTYFKLSPADRNKLPFKGLKISSAFTIVDYGLRFQYSAEADEIKNFIAAGYCASQEFPVVYTNMNHHYYVPGSVAGVSTVTQDIPVFEVLKGIPPAFVSVTRVDIKDYKASHKDYNGHIFMRGGASIANDGKFLSNYTHYCSIPQGGAPTPTAHAGNIAGTNYEGWVSVCNEDETDCLTVVAKGPKITELFFGDLRPGNGDLSEGFITVQQFFSLNTFRHPDGRPAVNEQTCGYIFPYKYDHVLDGRTLRDRIRDLPPDC
ncbi:hypothetical protein HDIA_1863 [Hartmannibacter diazotrophicus]|uniref:Uncharacterized protein n=1 Tax=Hartmannibacter diazotrophicus TaxID=1482074 RepID=A0A2C9D517_9HYPH|nr:hypothetical protein [Hartmannibacter diazotrophicus]SON55404.1 hypothetical protein HDIA_1863 [Hartmannibacter diazotrophicus]